jgi:predicted nucleic acid-binding protein
MLVVADSSPIQYLVLIGQAELFPKLFRQVVIPEEVARELAHDKTPRVVREFMDAKPEWLIVQSPRSLETIPGIDPGEQAAILLAIELAADLLLIDDLDGRRAAQSRGIAVTGTLGVLDRAAARDILDLAHALDQLKATSMRLSDKLVASLLQEHERRRKL